MSMKINKKESQKELVLSLEGSLDTSTAPLLEAELKRSIESKSTLVLDFSGIEYISSAGLRVLLSAQKIMNCQGTMLVKNVNKTVMDVFEITGFCDILTIE